MKGFLPNSLSLLLLSTICNVGMSAITAQFEFNGAANTLASASKDTITGTAAFSDFSNTSANATALHDGNGNLVFTGNVDKKNLTAGAIFGGSAYIRLDFSSWNTSGSGNNFDFSLRLRDTDTNGAGNVSAQFRVNGSTNNKNNLIATNLNNGSYKATAFNQPSDDSNGFSVILGYDLDNTTYSVWYDTTRNGTYTQGINSSAIAISAATDLVDGWEQVNAITLDTVGNSTSDYFALDFLAVGDSLSEIQVLIPAAVPEPSTYALLFGVLGFSYVIVRRKIRK